MLALNYYKIDEDIKNRVLGSYFYHSLKDAVMRNRRKKKSQLVKVKQQLKESEIKNIVNTQKYLYKPFIKI